MKPVRLCSKLIINSSRVNETVGDLFLGSGSTIIACIQTKRNCVGLELDPIYMQAIVDRTKQFLEKNNIEYEFTKH
jgi:DNA modification methylase